MSLGVSGCRQRLLALCNRLGWMREYNGYAAAPCLSAARGDDVSPSEQQREFLARRAEYESRMSTLRKRFAAELAEKTRERLSERKKKRDEEMRVAQQRRIAKGEERRLESPSLEEEKKSMRAGLEALRKEKELRRLAREEKLAARRQGELEKLRDQSGTWVEEKDLEHRIHYALNNPHQF